jgi:tRNA(Ile)-lysidine synthase
VKKVYDTINQYCVEHELLTNGDGIVIGLSGGMDSVCLLQVLAALRNEWQLRLVCVHVHHGIRGTAADEDAAFAQRLAAKYNISFRLYEMDIPQLAKEQGLSEEEAGRNYRYRCFEEVRKELNFDKIAVAHHRDDQAETVLWQILRGSGLRGVCGMRAGRANIIRPLLCLDRQQIEQIVRGNGDGWREDATNREEKYTRNKIRNRVFPYIEQEIQPMARRHLVELAEDCQRAWDYIERQMLEQYERLVYRDGDTFCFSVDEWKKVDPYLQGQLLMHIMEQVCGSRKDIGRVHVDALLRLAEGATGKRLDLPYHMRAGKDYDKIWIRVDMQSNVHRNTLIPLRFDERTVLQDSNGQEMVITLRLTQRDDLPQNVPKNDCTKWFDCDRMYADVLADPTEKEADRGHFDRDNGPVWRFPQEGDYLQLTGAGGTKTLARIFIDAKISVDKRGSIPVLAMGKHIIWIPELGRVSAAFYVTEATKHIITAQLAHNIQTKEKGGVS